MMILFERRSMSVLMALLLTVCLADVGAQESAKSMIQAARKQAKQAVGKKGEARAEELRKALDLFRLVPKTWPDARDEVAQAHLQSAEIEERLGDAAAAMRSLDAVIGMEVRVLLRAQALTEKAGLLRKQKDTKGALETLDRLTSTCGEEEKLCAQAWLTKASIARQDKNWDVASNAAQTVLDGFPDLWRENVDAADLVCSVLIRRHDWTKAVAKLEELDKMLEQRFSTHEKWTSIQKAMQKMVSRRMLSVRQEEDESSESS